MGSGSWCDPGIGSIAGPSELTDGKPEPDSLTENFYRVLPVTDSERTMTPPPPMTAGTGEQEDARD